MKSLDGNRLEAMRINGEILRNVGLVHYHRGRQDVYMSAKREVLEDLRQDSITQGTKASNDIESITISEERYLAIAFEHQPALTSHEQEVLGYRDTLDYIHSYYDRIEIVPDTIKDLHRRIYARVPGYAAGAFRQERNEIIRSEGGVDTIVYQPPPWQHVESSVEGLCARFHELRTEDRVDRFALLAAFIFDFTCIHPFMNGNGRVSRLLTNLLAYHLGFEFVRYIPHERIIADRKQQYYAALTSSSKEWARAGHNWTPWLNFLALVFAQCGQDLEERLASAANLGHGYKTGRIREVIQNLPTHFTIRDIITVLPHAPRPTIVYVLKELKAAGKIATVGKGPHASYRKVGRI